MAKIIVNGFRFRGQDLTGRQFGFLKVITLAGRKLGRSGGKSAPKNFWITECVCGEKHTVFGGDLTRGHTRSCGCKKGQMTSESKIRHGYAAGQRKHKTHPLYEIWGGIKARCNNPNKWAYKYYGGRGISYDPKWEKFEGFLEDMGPQWRDGLTIDRINNNGNYCKENCRWATMKEQSQNTSRNVFREYKGKKYTLSQLAAMSLVSYGCFLVRIHVLKWSLERAMTTPTLVSGKRPYQLPAKYRPLLSCA